MAAAVETISTATNSTATNTCTLNVPSGTTDGELLIAIVSKTNTEAFSEPSGWNVIEENVSAISTSAAAYWRIASSEPASYSWTWTSAVKNTGLMIRISGHDGFDAGDITEFGSNTAAPVSPAATAANADSLVLRFLSAQGNGSLALNTNPSGYTSVSTLQTTGGGSQFLTAWEIDQAGAGSTGTLTWDLNAATRCEAGTIVIAPGSSVQNLTATAPAASTASVGTHALSQSLTAAAPAASTADVTAPALSQNIVAGAPAASTASVGSHTIENVGIDFTDWSPVNGFEAYEWDDGANVWTDIDIVDDLGLSEASADIGAAIQAHFNVTENRELRLRYVIPAGVWNLTSLLLVNRDKKRIAGAGMGQTIIRVSGAGVIKFQGFDGSVSAITGSPSRGDTTVTVADASIAAVDETITIRQNLDDTVPGTDDAASPYNLTTITPETWATQAWEQIVKVTAVDTGTDVITFTPPLALDYDSGKSPEVKRYNNVYLAGIEDLTLDVVEDTGIVAIQFDRVRECYAHRVRVIDHAKMGIQITESHNVEVAECVVIGARDTGTGGNGYGIMAELGSSMVYIHDCYVQDQRHAYLLQAGVSHAIVAYNVSGSPSVEDLTDMSLHGHNVHHCLVEGNIFYGCVEVNDFYTQTQKNVLFRNRILGNSSFWDATSQTYSFWLRRNSTAAIVANRCETTNQVRIFDGSGASLVDLNGNSDAPTGVPDSLYLSAKPAGWGVSYTWPPFAGNDVNEIPAESIGTDVILAAAPAASTADVVAPALSQNVVAGAPAASTASVGSHTLLQVQVIAATAPAASTTSVGAHTLTQGLEIIAGAPAASTADVTAPALSLQIDATAPVTATSDVTSPALVLQIVAGAPATPSSSILGAPVLGLNLVAAAPAPSTASVGDHAITSGQTVEVGSPAASTASVIAPALSLQINATAPAASTAAVGAHVLTQGLEILAGAPAASTAGVTAPALSLNIIAGAPAASTATVGDHVVSSTATVVAGPPAASNAQVLSPSLAQSILALAPAASTADVTPPVVSQSLTAAAPAASLGSVVSPALSLNLAPGAPAASTAAVLDHSVILSLQFITATAPAASTASVGNHTLTGGLIPDRLVVTVAPAVDLSVTVAPAVELEVSVYARSGMNTVVDSGEVVTIEGTFTSGGVAANATGTVILRVEHPDGTVTVNSSVANTATGVYTADVQLKGGGVHRWRMYSSDGYGVAQGEVKVKKNVLTPDVIAPAVIASTAEVLDHTVALV